MQLTNLSYLKYVTTEMYPHTYLYTGRITHSSMLKAKMCVRACVCVGYCTRVDVKEQTKY